MASNAQRIHVRTRADFEALPPDLQAKVREEWRLNKVRRSLAKTMEHCGVTLHKWQKRALCPILTSITHDTLRGIGRNVVLQAAPRVGKTFTIGEWWVPWSMRLATVWPNAPFDGALPVMLIGNEQGLARDTSTAAQANYLAMQELFGTGGRGPQWTKEEWETSQGGRARTKGIKGNVTGKGYLIGVPDDLLSIGNTGQAAKDHAWDTFRRQMLSRRMTGASTVMMAHRLATDDPSGRWMDWMDEHGIPYEVYTFRMEAEEDEVDINGEVWRKAGELLCPALVDEQLVREAKADAWFWSTTYQQHPTKEGGAIIREEWLGHRFPGPPQEARRSCLQVAVVIDPAAKTKERNDPSAIGVIGKRGDGKVAVLHVEAKRREYPETKQRAIDLAQAWGATAIVVEDTSVGQALVPDLRRSGIPAVAVSVQGRGDKVARMTPYLSMWESGMVLLPESAPWVSAFVHELTTVPDAKHDDQWDMMSVALRHFERATMQRLHRRKR